MSIFPLTCFCQFCLHSHSSSETGLRPQDSLLWTSRLEVPLWASTSRPPNPHLPGSILAHLYTENIVLLCPTYSTPTISQVMSPQCQAQCLLLSRCSINVCSNILVSVRNIQTCRTFFLIYLRQNWWQLPGIKISDAPVNILKTGICFVSLLPILTQYLVWKLDSMFINL